MCKTSELLRQLTEEEQQSLQCLRRGPMQEEIPFAHAEKFLGLGLAELVCGYQALTISGKRAVMMLRR